VLLLHIDAQSLTAHYEIETGGSRIAFHREHTRRIYSRKRARGDIFTEDGTIRQRPGLLISKYCYIGNSIGNSF